MAKCQLVLSTWTQHTTVVRSYSIRLLVHSYSIRLLVHPRGTRGRTDGTSDTNKEN